MSPDRFDPASFVAGIVLVVFGGALMLDQADVLEIPAKYLLPLALASVGGILLACGLAGRPPGRS